MTTRRVVTSSRHALAALATLTLGLGACSDATLHPSQPPLEVSRQDTGWPLAEGEGSLKVLTWNAYLGGDTGPLFTLDFSDLPGVAAAARAFWEQVRASDVPGRAAAIADEIDAQRPHLVALQEVARFVEVDAATGRPLGSADLLAALQEALAARGLPYDLIAVQDNTSSALPLDLDAATGAPSRLLAFTDRLAVLGRRDLHVVEVEGDKYAASFALGPLDLERGWIRVGTEVAGKSVHLVNTHLESQALAPVQAAQVEELLGSVLGGLDGLTVLVGDLNSDAAAQPGEPSWTPTYGRLLEAGFVDGWIAAPPFGHLDGLTCCQDPDLRNTRSALDERIDFVLLREAGGGFADRIHMDVVGERRQDWTDGGLWPSDHAGLAAGLRARSGSAHP